MKKEVVTENSIDVRTPVGIVRISARENGIVRIDFVKSAKSVGRAAGKAKATTLLKKAAKELAQYFDGKRKTFSFRLDTSGTPFQKKVWKALQDIPYGKVLTYGDIAKRIGQPKAARAVGMANNRNPVAIVVPCHRVVGAQNKLVGYAGGLDKKRWLLDLEKSAS